MLKPTDTETQEYLPAQGKQPDLEESLISKRRVQPLGVLLVFRRDDAWYQTPSETRQNFDFENPVVLKQWEKQIQGRIYRIYGYHEQNGEAWEFFSLLEFDDLEAWNNLQQRLDNAGFSTYFSWDIITLGRRLG